jgi:hypothetical protein
MLRAVLLFCAVLSAGLVTGPADARSRDRSRVAESSEPQEQHEDKRDDKREDRRKRRDGSADAARRAVQRNGGGRVLSVEPQGAGYRVKVIKDGEVRMHDIEDR